MRLKRSKCPALRKETAYGPLSRALNSRLFVLVVPIFLQGGSPGSNVDLVSHCGLLA